MNQSANHHQHSNLPADFHARTRALDSSTSYIVRAPAGSGKTSLLVARFLVLLAKVNQPEHILAITHTNKAAQQMLERIHQALSEPQTIGDCLTRDAAHQALLSLSQKNMSVQQATQRLRVQTVDSLCANLARISNNQQLQYPHSQTIDDPLTWYQTAANFVVRDLWEKPDSSLLEAWQHYACDALALEQVLVDLLQSREQWLTLLTPIHQASDNKAFTELLAKGWRNELTQQLFRLAKIANEELQQCIITAKMALEMINCIEPQFQQTDSESQQRHHLRQLLSNIINCPLPQDNFHTEHKNTQYAKHSEEQLSEQRLWWANLQQWLLTKDMRACYSRPSSLGFPADSKLAPNDRKQNKIYKQHAKELLERLQNNAEFVEVLQLPLPFIHLPASDINLLTSIAKLAVRAAAWLHVLFSREGVSDFTQTALGAIDALQQNDFQQAFETSTEHILVDEFQDISPLQWQLVELLTQTWQGKQTLFVVGDPMQSIYGFRKAEVALFSQALRQGIGNIPLQRLDLTTNFRSNAELVTWVNSVGDNVFANNEEVAFFPSQPSLTQTQSLDKVSAKIQAQQVTDATKQVITIVQETLQSHSPNHSIALLLQKRTIGAKYIQACQQAQINYHAIDMLKLGNAQHIVDISNLARWLENPHDWKATLGILRMPQIGLSLDFCTWIYQFHPKNAAIALQKALANAQEKLLKQSKQETDSYQRLVWLWERLRATLVLRGSQNFTMLLENIWHNLGFALSTNVNEQQQAYLLLSKIDALVAKSPGKWSLPWHDLEHWLNQQYRDGVQIFQANAPVVHIMTCHKAKGLEFDTVIIPETDSNFGSSRGWRKPFVYLANPILEQPFLMAASASRQYNEAPANYLYIQKREQSRQLAEQKRLLYVAITRAKQHLWLLKKTKDDISATKKSVNFAHWLEQAGVVFTTPTIDDNKKQTLVQSESIATQTSMPLLTRLENFAELQQNCPSLGHLETSLHTVPIDVEQQDTSPKMHRNLLLSVSNDRQQLGNQLHKVMQDLQAFATQTDTSPSLSQLAQYIANNRHVWHRQLLWNAPNAGKTLAEQFHRLLDTLANDPRLTWLCTKRQYQYSEQHWLSGNEDMPVHNFVDLSFRHEGILWIVDYKLLTKKPNESNQSLLARAKKHYEKQLLNYAQLVVSTGETDHVRCGIYIFDYSLWTEWAVAPHLS